MSDSKDPLKVGFLVSRYPGISQTYILREVLCLRVYKHFETFTASINEPDRPENRLTEEEWHEAKKTYYIKSKGFFGALNAFVYFFIRSPWRLVKTLGFSLALGKTDVARILFNIFYFGEALILARWMAVRKIQHLHVHFANPASTVALISSKLTRKTFSITVHGQEEFSDITLNLLKEKIAGAAFICCIGYYPMSQLMQMTPPQEWKKFSLCRLGIDVGLFSPVHPDEKAPIRIICIGKFIAAKGQPLLLTPFAKLVEEYPDLQLILVGDGPERRLLEESINSLNLKDNVRLTGMITAAEVLVELQQSDIFVLPCLSQGLPVALMEAMAMEIPVIASAVCGIPELVEHCQNGFLVPPGDLYSLYRAMKMLIEKPELRKAMGVAARKKIQEEFNLETNVEEFAEVLRYRLLELSKHPRKKITTRSQS